MLRLLHSLLHSLLPSLLLSLLHSLHSLHSLQIGLYDPPPPLQPLLRAVGLPEPLLMEPPLLVLPVLHLSSHLQRLQML